MRMFHLDLAAEDVAGATLAILPGDPGRVERIAQQLSKPIFLTSRREFTSWRGVLAGQPIVVCSTGIGGPSTSIAVEELAQLGIRTFLRVGTTGAIQPRIGVGDLIVTTGAVRLDGASQHFAPLAFPAVADFSCTSALVHGGRAQNVPVHVGITASSDTFYPGQERYDTHSQRVVAHLRGSRAEWEAMGVLNYEMESATLLTMCAASGLRAGCVAGVLVNRSQQEHPDEQTIHNTEQRAIQAVIAAAKSLLTQDERT